VFFFYFQTWNQSIKNGKALAYFPRPFTN